MHYRVRFSLLGFGLVLFISRGTETSSANEAPTQLEAQVVAQFERLHGLIKPKLQEQKWTQIPWLTSLWEARKQAAEEGKPILLWEMDGHPLGCT